MTEIFCPTIDLFLYDLGRSLDDSAEDISKNRQYFQAKLHPSVQQQLHQIDANDLLTEYKYLLNHPYYTPLEPNTTLDEGYYYPVQLGDSYGLLLEYSHANKKEPQSSDCFREVKSIIEQKLVGNIATLGQTWMLSAYVSSLEKFSEAEVEIIAQNCYQALMPDLKWDEELDGKGGFLGATIFELSSTQLSQKEVTIDNKKSNIITQDKHVIIAIYPNEESFNLLSDFYTDWMRLFYYRHKILWAYGQSLSITKALKEEFSQIYTDVEAIENRLDNNREFKKLKDILIKTQSKLSFYTINLNKLNFQPSTIEINLSNYQKRIQTLIQKQIKKQIENDLSFLEKFTNITQEKYLLQIAKDSESLQLGLKLLEDIINGVRSRVELEKAEQDKFFQESISLIGIGWATANIVSKHIPLGKKKQGQEVIDPFKFRDIFPRETFYDNIPPLMYSFGIAFIIIVALLIFRNLWLKIGRR